MLYGLWYGLFVLRTITQILWACKSEMTRDLQGDRLGLPAELGLLSLAESKGFEPLSPCDKHAYLCGYLDPFLRKSSLITPGLIPALCRNLKVRLHQKHFKERQLISCRLLFYKDREKAIAHYESIRAAIGTSTIRKCLSFDGDKLPVIT